MKRKGFTLVELLVVIAIIALLMGILMPALAKVKQIANRIMCGSNLSSTGKAMMLYSNDFDLKFPRSGGPRSVWGSDGYIAQWDGPTVRDAFGAESGAPATISSTFFMLIRYVDMTPKQFICKGDIRNTEFKLSNWGSALETLSNAHDFGDQPALHCSYSMHLPFIPMDAGAPVVPASEAGSPLCADRNPYLDVQAHWLDGEDEDFPAEPPTWDVDLGYIDLDKSGNSQSHEREGQNVLFNDGHVNFEEHPNCGINNDNIWKWWPGPEADDQDKQLGDASVIPGYGTGSANTHVGSGVPVTSKDAYLVNEDQRVVGAGPPIP